VIVTDANLIAQFAIRDVGSDLADAVCEADPVWVAPMLWRSEVRNTVLKYVRHAGMSLDAALLAMHTAEEIVSRRDYTVNTRKVLELAVASGCTAYDCEYVALALDMNVSLVTSDKQVLRAFPKLAMSPENFLKRK
jgi:predicted nucleic acid-binding protein